MELNIMYPIILIITIIFIVAIFFVLKKYRKFKRGVIVANTKYVKNSNYYKQLMHKYRIFKIIINACCIISIILCAILTSRLNYRETKEEYTYSRDILLCMDASQSLDKTNAEIIKELKETIQGLQSDRFGITIFDGVPISLIPITSDNNYVVNYLQDMLNNGYDNQRNFFRTYFYAGTQNAGRGNSLIGEGLAYCVTNFSKNTERTKVIILSTDNQTLGNPMISLSDAAEYAKNNNVKVYAIGAPNINDKNKEELQTIAKKTDGEYFGLSTNTPKEIISQINELTATPMPSSSYVLRVDVPELIFLYLLIATFVLYVIDWRMKI